jgi:autotransporter-associated beta strand protein
MMPAVAAAGALLAIENAARATNGTWTFLNNGTASWSLASNWASGVIADGASGTADFSKLNITQDMTVNLDSSRTIGQLLFGDTTQSNQWTLDNNGDAANVLTLNNGASQPVINITTTNQLTTISAVIAGTNGLSKTGNGRLQLSGSNTFTGQVTLGNANNGDIVVNNNSALGNVNNLVYIDPSSSTVARLQLNAGITVSNPIEIHTARGPLSNGILQTNGNVASATFAGAITIDSPANNGGDLSGPNDTTLTNFLTFSGPITISNLYPAASQTNTNNGGVTIRTGNLIFSGGGSYYRLEIRTGESRLGASNGIATNAYVDLGVNNGNPNTSVNATLDLFGFNQTIVGLSNISNQGSTVTNSANAPSVLTITPGIAVGVPNTPPNLSFTGSVMTDTQGSNPNSLLSVVVNGAPNAVQTFNNNGSSYHGSTTLISGILSVNSLADGGANSAIGASSSDASNLVFSGGTLRYTGTDTSTNRNFTISTGSNAVIDVSSATSTLTLNGAGTGSGGLTKIGAGTLLLSSNQTYTGNTTISGGALVVNGNVPASSNVSIAAAATLAGTGTIGGVITTAPGAIISPGGAGSTGTITVGGLTLGNGGQINFEFDSNNDQITVANSNGLTLNGGNLFLLNTGALSAFASNGTYTLFNINGGFTGSLDNLTISNPVAGKFYNILNNGTLISLTIGDATTVQWTNTSGNDSWTTGGAGGNWNGAAFPNAVGQTASFGSLATGSGSVNLNGNKTVSGLIFNNSAVSSFDIFGSGNLTIDNGSAAGAITVNGGNHAIDVPIVLNGAVAVMTTNGGDSLNINGNISGAFPMTVAGPGTLTLTGTNSFTNLSVSSGTVNVGNNGVGGTLGTGSVTLSNGAVLNFAQTSNYNFGQSITGSGTINQIGSGTTTVGAVNVTQVNVSNGALITSSIAQSGGINVTGGGQLTANGTVSGAGSLNVNSTGVVSLAASNSYTGGTRIDAGTVVLNAAGALPANSALAVNGGTLDLNARNISLSNITDGGSTGGVITNNGAAGTTSTVTFTGNNATYNMYAALNDGANGGKVAFISTINNNNAASLSLIMHASSSYSGGTTITRQSLDAYASNALGTGSVLIQANNASVNATHLGLAGGVTLPNDVVIQQPNPGTGTLAVQYGAISYLLQGPSSGDATLTGHITVQADSFTGGTFAGPNNFPDLLNINGPVTTTAGVNSISVYQGRVGFAGGGSYPQLDIFGTTVAGAPGIAFVTANNGIPTSAIVNLVAGTLDLNGNNQTLAGLIGAAGGATNGSGTFSTLTLHVTTDRSTGGSINGNLNLVKNGPAAQTISAASGASNYQGNTIVQNGALALVGSGAWSPVTNNGNSSAFTDIQGGRVVFDYNNDSDPTGQVNGLLAASYTPTGSFNNTTGAIRSSTGTGTLGLGINDDMNLKLATVAYTVFGDANLDGRVNALDFNALASNFGTGNIWYQGDFNYDNVVNSGDFTVLAQNFNKVAPIPTAGSPLGTVLGTLVPEPTAMGFVVSAVGLIFSRRRRSKKSD